MEFIASMEVASNRKIPTSAGIRTLVVQSIVYSEYWLNCWLAVHQLLVLYEKLTVDSAQPPCCYI